MKIFVLALITAISTVATPLSAYSKIDTLPRVFTVGEYGKEYEKLVADCELPLLQAQDMSMDKAADYWLSVMKSLEDYAEGRGFDIKGVKLWINIFWKPDGYIKHIVYFPKRSSRNIDFDELARILDGFSEYYSSQFKAPSCYSHFGSASFPTHADYYLKK